MLSTRKTPCLSKVESEFVVSSNHGCSDSSDSRSKSLGWSTYTLVGLWETGIGGELDNVATSAVLVEENASSNNLDGFTSSAMSSGHFLVHLGDSSAKGVVSVLLVHVDCTSSGQVTEEDSVVPDASGFLLEDLAGGDDLSLDLSDLVLTLHVIPELGTSNDWVAFKHSHSVQSWVWVSFAGQGTAHDVELSNLNQ